jgi:hypothetical protein
MTNGGSLVSDSSSELSAKTLLASAASPSMPLQSAPGSEIPSASSSKGKSLSSCDGSGRGHTNVSC